MTQHSIKNTLFITSYDLNLLVWSWCLRLTHCNPASTVSVCLGCSLFSLVFYLLLSSPASLRYMTSSFKKRLLSCRREKLEGNGEGEMCESCGNSCQRQLIKHRFISCGVTNINRDGLKWPLEEEINHCLSRQRKWTCVCVHTENSNTNQLFVTNHNLQWHGVRHRWLNTTFHGDITHLKTWLIKNVVNVFVVYI